MDSYFEKIRLNFEKVVECGRFFDAINFNNEDDAKKTLEKIRCDVHEIFKPIEVKNEHEFHHNYNVRYFEICCGV